jgi:hypothetical protein
MDPLEPTVPARMNTPVIVVLLVAALLLLGIVFAWPW